MTIISASRRTDIPAFYSEWFMNRVREGYFIKVNPFNPSQRREVSLSPPDVDAIVFWTKNPFPMLQHVPVLDRMGHRYFFHYTLNSYPLIFEPRVPPLKSRVEIFQRLGDRIGKEKIVWRYDPIMISNFTPVEYHEEQFAKLAEKLSGYTGRVVISFLVLYHKVRTKLKKLEKDHALRVIDAKEELPLPTLKSLAGNLSIIAKNNGMEIFSCSEKLDFEECGIKHGSCIDVNLINQVFKTAFKNKKDRYQRPECLCAESVDLGFYDTCKFNCSYCYANLNDQTVLKNNVKHHPENPALLD